MEGEQILFVAIYYMYHRRFYHIFTLKYVQVDTFETSIYISLYYIYIVCPYNCTSFVDFVADFSPMDLAFFDESRHRNLPGGSDWTMGEAEEQTLFTCQGADGPMVFCFCFFFRCFLGDELSAKNLPSRHFCLFVIFFRNDEIDLVIKQPGFNGK